MTPTRETPRSLARDTPRDTTPARTTQTPPENARARRHRASLRRRRARTAPPAEPAREPSTPADTRSLDYGSLSAFRGGSRSTGSASSVYTDSPSTAAAVARITYTLDAYGDAIAARDLDALRDVRSPVTPAEAALLKEGRHDGALQQSRRQPRWQRRARPLPAGARHQRQDACRAAPPTCA